METNKTGKFIVFYGINNLGKTTQAKMLVARLNAAGEKAEYLKYPVYDLEPSGKILNNYLRGNNPDKLTPREAQIIYTTNRFQYEQQLKKKLKSGIHIIAEDYIGTGLAWGIGAGVEEGFLKNINSHLLKEDQAFLFDGNRFREAEEKNHKHETDEDLINKVRWAHLTLGQEYNWIKINANLSIKEIYNIIWEKIENLINNNNFPPFLNTLDCEKSNYQPTLKIEKIKPNTKIPKRAYSGDAGLDLYSADYYSLFPGDSITVSTGIKMAIPVGYAGLIWDKSGVAKSGIHTTAGVIDSNYRGEIMVNMINLSEDIYNIAPGQKIAQILIQPAPELKIKETEINDNTNRNANAFGSSGLF